MLPNVDALQSLMSSGKGSKRNVPKYSELVSKDHHSKHLLGKDSYLTTCDKYSERGSNWSQEKTPVYSILLIMSSD